MPFFTKYIHGFKWEGQWNIPSERVWNLNTINDDFNSSISSLVAENEQKGQWGSRFKILDCGSACQTPIFVSDAGHVCLQKLWSEIT